MSSLHEKGVLEDKIYKDLVRSLDLIEKLRKAMAEWKNVRKEASLPRDILKLKSVLKSL
jgi:hypothetical protein